MNMIEDLFTWSEELPDYLSDKFNSNSCAISYHNTGVNINYYLLDRLVTPAAKFLGLFSSNWAERQIVNFIVKVINEECLHQLINDASPKLPAHKHHAVIAELRLLFRDQYCWHQHYFSKRIP